MEEEHIKASIHIKCIMLKYHSIANFLYHPNYNKTKKVILHICISMVMDYNETSAQINTQSQKGKLIIGPTIMTFYTKGQTQADTEENDVLDSHQIPHRYDKCSNVLELRPITTTYPR